MGQVLGFRVMNEARLIRVGILSLELSEGPRDLPSWVLVLEAIMN